MKATFNRKSLLEAFTMASGVVPTRSPKPILQNVKMTVGADGCTLVATDLEVGVRRRVLGSIVVDDGDVILPTARFSSILKTSGDDEVSIETGDDGILVRAGRSKFKLGSEDPTLFPDVPDFDAASYAVLIDSDLRSLIRKTSYACDLNTTRYALGGALVERGDDSLTFVATDGRRLAKVSVPCEHVGDGSGWTQQAIIPAKALKLIANATPGDGTQAHLGVVSGKAIMIRTDDAVVYSRLLEGRFPDYSRVFPPSPLHKIPLNVGSLRVAVDQASILTSEESRGVNFEFGSDELRLTTSAADVGQADVRLAYAAPIEGLDVALTIDPRFVGDLLRAEDQEAEIVIELVDAANAVVFRAGENCTSIIMPLSRS